MKTYKGFNKDMTCRGFQYEEGKEYETDKAVACESGFHACEYSLDCFDYYPPNESVYYVVEQDGDISKCGNDTKVASTKIKIGVRLGIADMVKAAIEFTLSKIKPEAKSDKDYGASSATGYCCSVEANDPCAIGVAWGYKGRGRGVIGARIVLADWEGKENAMCWKEEDWILKGARMIRIDGKKYKENTWYTMKDGQIVEWTKEREE